jgi:hypothetical protein
MALYAFDGTSKEDDVDDAKDSNVVRFTRAYRGRRVYRSGVGTRFGAVGRVLGGWMGIGLHDRVGEALDELKRNFQQGDRAIDVIGFSRGAAAALHFVNEVWEKVGHKQPDAPRIRFVGLFDTVASTGVLPGKIDIDLDLELPPNVDKCCHAMALDESRASFHLHRVRPRGAPLPAGTVEEVWFRGCHSDIGGGDHHDALANIALVWMLRRAVASGLQFDADEVKSAMANRNGAADIIRAGFDKQVRKREVRPGDHIHCSVAERANHINPPVQGCLVVDDLGDVRGSYPGVMTWPVDIDWQGALRERVLLRPGGEAHTMTVFAREEWNESPAVYLEADNLYRFEVVGDPIDWVDGDVTETNGADGYEHLALKPFKHLARMPGARWFQLIGAVDRGDLFAIGRTCDHRPQRSGEFACFANDARFKYENNRGQLSLSVRRLE